MICPLSPQVTLWCVSRNALATLQARTTVFRRNLATSYQLRAKTSRAVYSDISARFPTLPFSLRQLRSVRDLLGVKECVTRSLLIPFDPRFEKRGEFVVRAVCHWLRWIPFALVVSSVCRRSVVRAVHHWLFVEVAVCVMVLVVGSENWACLK